MKSIVVARIQGIENDVNEIALYLQRQSTGYEYIDILNWPVQFPYKPDCRFKTGYTKTDLWIQFFIRENSVKAVYQNDNEAVWEDSCVEFFCKRPDQKSYYNFEFNCIGTALATERLSKIDGILPFSPDKMKQIKRISSLGTVAFDEKEGPFEWLLTVGIPLNFIGVNPNLKSKLEVNFYKCGDETSTPHFLSWNPIITSNPDFHRPEYFGELYFA